MTLQELTKDLQQARDAVPDPSTAKGLSRQEQDEYAGRRSHLTWQIAQASPIWDRLQALGNELHDLREWRDTLVTVRAEMQTELDVLEASITPVSTPVGYEGLKLGIQVCDHGANYSPGGWAFTGALAERLTQRGIEPLPGENSVTAGRRLSIASCDYRISELEPQLAQAQTEWQRLEQFVDSLAATAS